ncbi:unnamed protein product [Orchesella dallaii]|uniref:C2H2-type domain-containing protein n=1 Tax=Orchesella dallaii TaxID=48710 RepID=A0ABP1R5U2_9HEXA
MEIPLHDNLLGSEIPNSPSKSSSTSGYGTTETSPDETSWSQKVLNSPAAAERLWTDNPRSISLPNATLNSKADDQFVTLADIPIEKIYEGLFNVPLAPVEAAFINGVDFGNNALPAAKSFTETTPCFWNSVGSERIVTPSCDERRFVWDCNAIKCINSPPLTDRDTGPPWLDIYCSKPFNVVNHPVSFVIRVHNLPTFMLMTPKMIEAVATSPTGKSQPCFVHREDSLIMDRSFTASFKAGDEPGFYEVQVKVVNPMETSSVGNAGSQDDRILTGSIKIPVSRNYDEDSITAKGIISCVYKPVKIWSPTNSSDRKYESFKRCKLWGLTANPCTNNVGFSFISLEDLFCADRFRNEVKCVDTSGRTLFKFGQFRRLNQFNSTKKLSCPTGITYDSTHGRLLIVDKDKHRVCFFSKDGQFISSFGTFGRDNGLFCYPWDVAVSPDGQHIVVSDPQNQRVQLFDRYGNFLRKFTAFNKNDFQDQDKYVLGKPRGVTFDGTGNSIYVTDCVDDNVIQIPLDFSRHHDLVPVGQLCRPQGIAVDGVGNLLIADSRHGCIRHVSPKRDLISNVTKVLDHPIQFPMNVTTLAGGNVAVLDGIERPVCCPNCEWKFKTPANLQRHVRSQYQLKALPVLALHSTRRTFEALLILQQCRQRLTEPAVKEKKIAPEPEVLKKKQLEEKDPVNPLGALKRAKGKTGYIEPVDLMGYRNRLPNQD